MQKKLALFLATAATLAAMSWQAGATPMTPAKQLHQSNTVTLVAESCGAGWHWSVALKRCVRN